MGGSLSEHAGVYAGGDWPRSFERLALVEVGDTFAGAEDVDTIVRQLEEKIVARRVTLRLPFDELRLDRLLTELELSEWFAFRQIQEDRMSHGILLQAMTGSSSRVIGQTQSGASDAADADVARRRWLAPACDASRVVPGRWLFDAIAMPHRSLYVRAYTQRCYLRRIYELRTALYDMVSTGVFDLAYPAGADHRSPQKQQRQQSNRRHRRHRREQQQQQQHQQRQQRPNPWRLPASFAVGAERVAPQHHIRRPHSHYHLMSPGDYKLELSIAHNLASDAYDVFFELGGTNGRDDAGDSACVGGARSKEEKDRHEAEDEEEEPPPPPPRDEYRPDAVEVGRYPKQFRMSVSSVCSVSGPKSSSSSSSSPPEQLHHPLRVSALRAEADREDDAGVDRSIIGPLVTTRRDLPVLACVTMPSINSFLDPAASVVEPLVIPTAAALDDYDRHVARLFETRPALADHPCRAHLTAIPADREAQQDAARTVRQRLPLSGLLIDVDLGMCRRLVAAHRRSRRRDQRRARAGQPPDRLLFWCLYCPAVNLLRFGCTRVDVARDTSAAPREPTAGSPEHPCELPAGLCGDVDHDAPGDAPDIVCTFRPAVPRVVDVPPLVPLPQFDGRVVL